VKRPGSFKRGLTGLALTALIAVSCTGSGSVWTVSPPPSAPTVPPPATPSTVPTGRGSAAAAMKALCVPPSSSSSGPTPSPGPAPARVTMVEQELQQVRGLTFDHPVPVEVVTQAQMAQKLSSSFDSTYPADFWNRRSRAWQTIGVIPAGASLRAALLKFQTGQVAGFYDPDSGQLVYVGSSSFDLNQKFTLAHELTHAIDDQHFDLKRDDKIVSSCRDEDQEAALGAIEGSAQYFAYQVMLRFPQNIPVGNESGGSLSGVPPFLTALELWPYTAGQTFITALDARGGTAAVNDALKHLPTSTEQVIHPDLYPSDKPVPVDIPNLAPKLGTGWKDLDVEQVGEEWLNAMLALRLDTDVAAGAAAGWGGGIYRAWSDGANDAVVLKTVWDTTADASEFAGAVNDWISKGKGQQAFVYQPDASTVVVGFASDASTLASLRTATGATGTSA
jgi:hypothetical protein